MSDAALRAATPLPGFHYATGGTTVAESTQQTIVSLGFSAKQSEQLNQLLTSQLGLPLPPVGQVSRNVTAPGVEPGVEPRVEPDPEFESEAALLRLQSDQCFLVTTQAWHRPVEHIHSLCRDAACYTDQSDSWAVLDIIGPLWRSAMERICSLDLAEGAFTTSHVARTTVEHMSVIIELRAEQHLRLYSPRSSARSFAHAIETSLRYASPQTITEE